MLIPRVEAPKQAEHKYVAIQPILLARGPIEVHGKFNVHYDRERLQLRETVFSADTLDEIAADLHTMVDKVIQGMREQGATK